MEGPRTESALSYHIRMQAELRRKREEEEYKMATADPENDGYQLAQAFTKLFGKPSPGVDAVSAAFSLGERFAEMSGYQGARAAMDYLRGFVSGLGVREQPKQITPGIPHDTD